MRVALHQTTTENPTLCGGRRASQLESGLEGRWVAQGAVQQLWLRTSRETDPVERKTLQFVRGDGIVGDCHATPCSPRQVLLASAEVYDRFGLPPATLRESITTSCDPRHWTSGSLVALGRQVVLRITFRCEPCARLNRHRKGLMRAVAADRGVLARVVRSGGVSVGDPIRVLPGALPSWSDVWRDRVLQVASRVPTGMVVQYAQLALLAGVPSSYCRVFPRMLGASPHVAHRVVGGQEREEMPRWTGVDLFEDEQQLGDVEVVEWLGGDGASVRQGRW